MKKRSTHAKRRGFSLLELLAVMSIMAMLSALAVTSYFNAVRGMARRSAVKHLANTLILARQRACMEGARVSVMLFNEVIGYDTAGKAKLAPSYVVCRELGRISYINQGVLVDEFSSLDKMFGTAVWSSDYLGSIRLYNLSQGRWSNVYPSVQSPKPPDRLSAYQRNAQGQQVLCDIPAFGFAINKKVKNPNDASWSVGDSYGLEVVPINSLPRGFEFDDLKANIDKVVYVIFQPDGSASAKKISIRTTLPPVVSSSVTVEGDGAIMYDEKWK
ncbi:MAG: type II secretion system protein [bacterium]